jgi:sugar phosphate isomerase/epimerase
MTQPDPTPLDLEAAHYRDTTRIHHAAALDAVRATIMEGMGWEDDRNAPTSDVPPGIIWETATDLAEKTIATLVGLDWMSPEITATVGRLLDRADEALDKLTAERDALTAQLNTKEPRS